MEPTERKKKRKIAIEEEVEEGERKFFKAASGLETQREDMNSFVQNFNRIQTEQLHDEHSSLTISSTKLQNKLLVKVEVENKRGRNGL